MLAHPRLAHALLALRPGAKPNIDFIVQDDGAGPYLVKGSMVDPPTQAEVDALTEAQLDAAQASKSKPDVLAAVIKRIDDLERDRDMTLSRIEAVETSR